MAKSNAALARELAASEAPIDSPIEARAGSDAAAFGRDFLLREYGDAQSIAVAMRKPGRPKMTTSATQAGASPTVRGRIPRAEYEKLAAIVSASGKSESELVREGIALVISRYAQEPRGHRGSVRGKQTQRQAG